MTQSRTLVAAFTSIALILAPCLSVADPGNGKGQPPHGQGHGKPDGGKHAPDRGGRPGGPSVDRGNVLGIVGGHRGYWSPGPALPPGVQKNLARGKPLPPGIAKKLDGRLIGHLPHYDGYEWMQAGADLILVAVATGIVYEILDGAFH